MTPLEMLLEFHAALDVTANEHPTLDVPQDVKDLRCRLIDEEFTELREALAADDIVEVADALADILYVVYGTAVTFGIPIEECLAEVHRSNMTKLGEDGVALHRADGKVSKERSFDPPDLLPVLAPRASDPADVERWRRAHAAFKG